MNEPQISDSDQAKIDKVVSASLRLVQAYQHGHEAGFMAYGSDDVRVQSVDEDLIVNLWLRVFDDVIFDIPDWQAQPEKEWLRASRVRRVLSGEQNVLVYQDCDHCETDDRTRIVGLWTSNFDTIQRRLPEWVGHMGE